MKLGITKKKELLSLDLSQIDDINETFDEYIDKQNIYLSFKENLEELTIYGSSEEFDKYKQFGKDKSFLVDKNIYLDIFETKLNEKKIEENKKGIIIQKRLGELEEYFEGQKRNINIYFGSINFYDDIDNKYILFILSPVGYAIIIH